MVLKVAAQKAGARNDKSVLLSEAYISRTGIGRAGSPSGLVRIPPPVGQVSVRIPRGQRHYGERHVYGLIPFHSDDIASGGSIVGRTQNVLVGMSGHGRRVLRNLPARNGNSLRGVLIEHCRCQQRDAGNFRYVFDGITAD